jgi:hypothetical protein
MWTVYGVPYVTGQLANKEIYQKITFHKFLEVRALKIWVVLVGSPTITGLRMNIYSNDVQTSGPGAVLATSTNSYDTADILTTYTNGVKEIYFEFNPLLVHASDSYHLVLSADTYSYTGSNQLAWKNVWPDPIYQTNFTVNGNNYLVSPLAVSAVIGEEIV